MNRALVDQIANAVFYEGYLLYPYRPSAVKNRQRWTFGGLYPQSHSAAQGGVDLWAMQTECLVHGPQGTLQVRVRFLHLVGRSVGELLHPVAEWPGTGEPEFRTVASLRVGGKTFAAWQEAVELEIAPADQVLSELADRPQRHSFGFPARRDLEPLRDAGGPVVGVVVRHRRALEGAVELSARRAGAGLFKVTVRVLNLTPLDEAGNRSREEVLLHALVSTHTILGVREGEFVSLLDPPEPWRDLAAACQNVGTWPVLVGKGVEKDTMLSSPIILPDYPQIAPESPGDLFDATEIDEILTLRILTLTDEEKEEMIAADERGRALLERTEALTRDQLMRLHGTVRSLRPLTGVPSDA